MVCVECMAGCSGHVFVKKDESRKLLLKRYIYLFSIKIFKYFKVTFKRYIIMKIRSEIRKIQKFLF
jgi:hypothetical protein